MGSCVPVGGWYGHPASTAVTIFVGVVSATLAGVDREEFPSTNETVDYKSNSEWSFPKANEPGTSKKRSTRSSRGRTGTETNDSDD